MKSLRVLATLCVLTLAVASSAPADAAFANPEINVAKVGAMGSHCKNENVIWEFDKPTNLLRVVYTDFYSWTNEAQRETLANCIIVYHMKISKGWQIVGQYLSLYAETALPETGRATVGMELRYPGADGSTQVAGIGARRTEPGFGRLTPGQAQQMSGTPCDGQAVEVVMETTATTYFDAKPGEAHITISDLHADSRDPASKVGLYARKC
ncbi:hypothetical protein GCM10010124_13200 [Pilimelia terevasa]|uniref:Secreted protein n=1 Tax=Pilimelia terevasa TaxID=53372 RepID=A0A8J3BMK7_9ACTN|nr:hypothetical protein [Pilimelia terevasa]GGK22084.1 hypothetical protein GCM10010124_13200 [Pilimelia terevasa]